jgi:hypothetical protein
VCLCVQEKVLNVNLLSAPPHPRPAPSWTYHQLAEEFLEYKHLSEHFQRKPLPVGGSKQFLQQAWWGAVRWAVQQQGPLLAASQTAQLPGPPQEQKDAKWPRKPTPTSFSILGEQMRCHLSITRLVSSFLTSHLFSLIIPSGLEGHHPYLMQKLKPSEAKDCPMSQ